MEHKVLYEVKIITMILQNVIIVCKLFDLILLIRIVIEINNRALFEIC